jgi:plastocyanin
MSMRSVYAWGLTLAVVGALSTAACGSGEPSSSQGAPAATAETGAPAQKLDPATAGEITGTITVDGPLPANAPIKMNADPICYRSASGDETQETYMVGADGKSLGNVFVYVKDGLNGLTFPPPTEPVVIDQKGCRYHPHVFGIQVGQPLEILNSDPTLHNIHAVAKNNREFNNGQPLQNMKTTHTFTAAEVMVPFKCDVHGWMNAFVGVLPHPYFSVSDTSGAFSLKSLPPGTYTIEAWHEKLGTMTETVTIGARETKDVNFVFKASAATGTN